MDQLYSILQDWTPLSAIIVGVVLISAWHLWSEK